MARKSASGDTPSEVIRQQAARLTRLRQLLGLRQEDAAGPARVTRDAWGRMERGDNRIDCVALALFTVEFNLPAGYVINGRYDGLPPDLLRDIIRAENGDQ